MADLKDSHTWPIVQITEEREAFIQQVVREAADSILNETKKSDHIRDIIEKTIYQERIRIKELPWNVDPKDDSKYWGQVKKSLLDIQSAEDSTEKKLDQEKLLLKEITYRYAKQTMGNFKVSTYRFAIWIVPILFNRMLNSVAKGWIRGAFSGETPLRKKVQIRGDLPLIQKLHQEHTMILLPTHFSNLDSVLLGYGIHLSGLPPFLYGAGLNLYNNKWVAYFIDRLGAYKLDRRKKNPIYLETLKAFSKIAIQRQCHTLFFPGGTRSRSGALEDKLKLGLLSTVIDAQIANLLPTGNQKKVIVVPMVIGYNFVLEAPQLIRDYLKKTGKEKFYLDKRDPIGGSLDILKWVWNFFAKGSDIVLSYGQPMDVLGNYVNESGDSIDKHGRVIEVSKYFVSHQELGYSKQRDAEYTRILAERIVEEYKKNNIVLASQATAYLAFVMLVKKYKELDLYNILRLGEEDRILNYHEFLEKLERFRGLLKAQAQQGFLKLEDSFDLNIHEFLQEGLENLGVFHAKKVLYLTKSGNLSTEDMHLLYFYHNRLTAYQFEHVL